MLFSKKASEHSPRTLADQQRLIRNFVADTVDRVMERLDRVETNEVAQQFDRTIVRQQLESLLTPVQNEHGFSASEIAEKYASEHFEQLINDCRVDLERYPIQDPALSNLDEVFYASNGFWATVAYRLANSLKLMGVPTIPRAISAIAHSKTGIDIHPGAQISPGLFIDHGTGIAIGCTAVLEENVSLYNGVVLGTSTKPSKQTDSDSGIVRKRHPTIGSGVTLYTNAFVGGDVKVGANAVIGAYAFVCEDVPANKTVAGKRGSENPVPSIHDHSSEHTSKDSSIAKTQGNDQTTPNCVKASSRPAILKMIGNTPMIEITHLHDNPNVRIFAKLEGANPSGSVKDRVALSLVEHGEASGSLTPDKIILESTSGNTGIGLAMVGAAKGYQVVLTMSSAMSEERKKVLRAFGATLIETDPTKGTGGAIAVAKQMVKDHPGKYWAAGQHSSLDNPLAHYEKTAEEILEQVPGVTHFVAGIGTFGTLRGAGVRLRNATGAKVVGIEPVLGQAIQGLRNMKEPNSPQLYDESLLDEKLMLMADDAYRVTQQLAQREGLLVGMSSGAAMHGALQIAEKIEEGTIVVLFPDRGEKYLSTSLFDQPQPSHQIDDIPDHQTIPASEPVHAFVGESTESSFAYSYDI